MEYVTAGCVMSDENKFSGVQNDPGLKEDEDPERLKGLTNVVDRKRPKRECRNSKAEGYQQDVIESVLISRIR